jgi:hypothetical protein
MRLVGVTITGADDTTALSHVEALSSEFPFVEWGILLSRIATRTPRPLFPSKAWIAAAYDRPALCSRLAGHVCGAWASELLAGRLPAELDLSGFGRVQFNIGACMQPAREADGTALATCPLRTDREYIIQVSEHRAAGLHVAQAMRAAGFVVSVLFDCSGGRGLSPASWPTPAPDLPCGFAGGLSPGNLAEELTRLEAVVGERELDLERVRQCLTIAREFRGSSPP